MKLLRISHYVSKIDKSGNVYHFAHLRDCLNGREWRFKDAENIEHESRKAFGDDWELWREFVDYQKQTLAIREYDTSVKGLDWGGCDIPQSIITNVKPSLYHAAVAILTDCGLADLIDNHQSDLYLPSIPIIDRLVKTYSECKPQSRFKCKVSGRQYWDIGFQYVPFWEKAKT